MVNPMAYGLTQKLTLHVCCDIAELSRAAAR